MSNTSSSTSEEGEDADEGVDEGEDDDDEDEDAFFDEEQDALAFVQGMEASDRLPFELLRDRSRNRHRQVDAMMITTGDGGDDVEPRVGGAKALPAAEKERLSRKVEEGDDDDSDEGAPQLALLAPPASRRTKKKTPTTEKDVPPGKTKQKAKAKQQQRSSMVDDYPDSDEDHVPDEFNEALAEQLGLLPQSQRRKGHRARRDLPEAVNKKLGEANLAFATNRTQEAIALCQEVIQAAPNHPDAYELMGSVYEEIDAKKSLNFLLIAAVLTRKSTSLWHRLANLSMQQGLLRQGVFCLSEVIKRDKKDMDARYDRAMVFVSLRQHRKAAADLEKVRSMRPEHPEVAKQLARVYFHIGAHEKAIAVLKTYWDDYPTDMDLTHVNLLAELLSSPEVGAWQETVDVLTKAKRELVGQDMDMPIELEVKLGSALARLGAIDAAEELLEGLFDHPVALFDDLYLAAADAFIVTGHDDKAEPFLRALTEDFDTNTSIEPWRRLAECKTRMEGFGAATIIWRAYTDSLDDESPYLVHAVMALADALRAAGDEEGAAQALGRLNEELPGAVEMVPGGVEEEREHDLLARASILRACGRDDLLINLSLPSLEATLAALETSDRAVDGRVTKRGRKKRKEGAMGNELTAAAAVAAAEEEDAVIIGYVGDGRRRRRPSGGIGGSGRTRKKTASRGDDEDDEMEMVEEDEEDGKRSGANNNNRGLLRMHAPLLPTLLKDTAPFQLLVDTVTAMIRMGRYAEAHNLADFAIEVMGKRNASKSRRDCMRILDSQAIAAQGEYVQAFLSLKIAALKWPFSTAIWNTFSQIQTGSGGLRNIPRFLTPLRHHHPTSLPLILAAGHSSLSNGAYLTALGDYFQAYRLASDEPLVLFCIAIALINQASSKLAPDRHTAVLQGFGFLCDYARWRGAGDSGECGYNLGRAAQQFSLNYLAVPLYERALEAAKERDSAEEEKGDEEKGMDGDDKQLAQTPDTTKNTSSTTTTPFREEDFDVSREAAFNLALIYKASGAAGLAKSIMKRYLTF